MRCPACGAPLVPDELQVGLYQCAQCGDVEVDEGGAYVRGRFYELGGNADSSSLDDFDSDAPPEEYVPTWEDVLAGDESAWPKED